MKKLAVTIAALALNAAAFGMTNLIVVGRTPANPNDSAFDLQKLAVYLVPAAIIFAGVIQFLYPRVAWYLKMFGKRWEYSGDIEPSNLWLFFTRLGGLLLVGVGVFLIITIRTGGKILPH